MKIFVTKNVLDTGVIDSYDDALIVGDNAVIIRKNNETKNFLSNTWR